MAVTVSDRPVPTGEGLTFEKVWVSMQETDRKLQELVESQKETDRQIKEYAFKTGLYVVIPSGETFDIFIPEGDYSPREW